MLLIGTVACLTGRRDQVIAGIGATTGSDPAHGRAIHEIHEIQGIETGKTEAEETEIVITGAESETLEIVRVNL